MESFHMEIGWVDWALNSWIGSIDTDKRKGTLGVAL